MLKESTIIPSRDILHVPVAPKYQSATLGKHLLSGLTVSYDNALDIRPTEPTEHKCIPVEMLFRRSTECGSQQLKESLIARNWSELGI